MFIFVNFNHSPLAAFLRAMNLPSLLHLIYHLNQISDQSLTEWRRVEKERPPKMED
jgi:hypothetical protein